MPASITGTGADCALARHAVPYSAVPGPCPKTREENAYIRLVQECRGIVFPLDAERLRGEWRQRLGFPAEAPLWVEVGCGCGFFAHHLAMTHAHALVLGVELRYKRLHQAARRLPAAANLRIVRYDGLRLAHALGREVDAFFLIYPDPWPRPRDRDRRLYSQLDRFIPHLRGGGSIHLRTDSERVCAAFVRAAELLGGQATAHRLDRTGRADLSAFDCLFAHLGAAAWEATASFAAARLPG
ncbi:MAG: hypothetical protein HYV63_16905 [Candidatus Schekmanbacteria bacterium]|nr:hypothetical protein [Candidatus Schekmanbacteria bacterium]